MLRLRLQVESPQQGLGLPFDRRRRIHQVDPPFPDYPAHGRRQERVVRAAEYDLVGSGIEHRAEQFVDPCQRFGRLLAVAFDQFDETFPDLRQDFTRSA